jgi:F-type H+-transporting ATPase subunit b
MLIDWFTTIAQLVNFLILVWLLKRFLYQPVLKALDEREKKIASELQNASAVQEEAEKTRAQWQQKNEAFEKERLVMRQQTEKEAAENKHHLFDDARKESDALRVRLQESLRTEQNNLQEEFIRRISAEVFSIAGHVLEELANVALEEKIVVVFCEHLQNIGKSDVAEMTAHFVDRNSSPLIRTAFTLTPEQRDKIQKTIEKVFSIDVAIAFETTSELLCGIELSMNGHSLSWNIKAYLDSLKKMAAGLLDGNTKTEANNDSIHSEKLP